MYFVMAARASQATIFASVVSTPRLRLSNPNSTRSSAPPSVEMNMPMHMVPTRLGRRASRPIKLTCRGQAIRAVSELQPMSVLWLSSTASRYARLLVQKRFETRVTLNFDGEDTAVRLGCVKTVIWRGCFQRPQLPSLPPASICSRTKSAGLRAYTFLPKSLMVGYALLHNWMHSERTARIIVSS